LVTVRTSDDAVDPIREIFKIHGAVDIEKRGAAWVATGWISFDSAAEPLSPFERAALRDEPGDDAVETHHQVRHYFHPQSPAPVGGGATNVATQYGRDEAGV
jgi:hypothetical protein